MLPTFEKYLNKVYLFTTSNFFTNSRIEILHKEPRTSLFNVSDIYSRQQGGKLTSGTSLALNLSIFFNKNVHLIGFDGYQTGHYYDENFDVIEDAKKAGIVGPAHNFSLETQILKKLKNVTFI
jgi:hypothetical protein